MDTSQSLRRAETIECWDDDPDFADLDLTHPTTSSSPPDTRPAMEHHYHHRRESWSSRMSIQSGGYDFDSPDGVDHEQQVLLDESPANAIASAINAGIPIPENVPSSALVGGTIKRLGTIRKNKKITAHDDWGEDLEIPTSGAMLKVRKKDNHEFPDSLLQLKSGDRSRNSSPYRDNLAPVMAASSKLNKYREVPDDEDVFDDCDEIPTLKLPPVRRAVEPKRSMASLLMTPPLSEAATPSVDDDFENDFEFPADAPLQLNIKTSEPFRQPVVHGLDSDFEEWTDGNIGLNLGSRFTGIGRDRGRNDDRRTSSVAMLSPTISSVTAESEDEAPLDGLELPEGILPNFHAILEKRKQAVTSTDVDMTFQDQKESAKDEFFEGIEIGDGDVFDARKLTLNRNVKHNPSTARQTSPARRGTMSLTFTTNTTSKAKVTTLPPQPPTPTSASARRLHHGHPTLASPIPVLEPVEEKETPQPVTKKKTGPRSRWAGAQKKEDENKWSSVNDAFTPNIPPPAIPQSRPERTRPGLANKPPVRTVSVRTGNMQENAPPPTTTNAQLLRLKRSLPNIQGQPRSNPPKPTRPPSRNNAQRPPSRTSQGRPPSSNGRPPTNSGGPAARPPSRSSAGRPPSRTEVLSNSGGRPKTPADRIDLSRKSTPFLPAGSSLHQSHHISAKITRVHDKAIDPRTDSRLRSRITPRHSPSSSLASNGTKRSTPSIAPEHLRREAAAIVPLTQPTRKRNFGDGTELEIFDDLPTSARIENRYVVTPVGRGAPKSAKAKNLQTVQTPVSTCNKDSDHPPPAKKLELAPRFGSQDSVPRFARDTNASRIAREQRMGLTSSTTSGASQWKSQLAARTASPKNRKKPQQKPHLIKPLGNISSLPKAQAVNGMTYNPRTYRWEGNEAEVRNFENQNTTPPRPALITNVNTSGSKMGIQVVGGMVFDPSRMCWLKVDEDPDESDDDPFEGVEDLMDHDMVSIDGHSGGMLSTGGGGVAGSVGAGGFGNNGAGMFGGGGARMSGGFGEFVVGEEFDVGPEFMRRQREEEDRWRKKVDGWISTGEATKPSNRWALRELLAENRL
ncbi:hypothetical protein RUND412_010364 [Rhizina undulata]